MDDKEPHYSSQELQKIVIIKDYVLHKPLVKVLHGSFTKNDQQKL